MNLQPSRKRASRQKRPPSHEHHARRGVVLLMVLIVLAASVTLASTYLGKQQTGVSISENVKNHAIARGAAESGMELVLAYLQSSDSWRNDQTVGTWASGVAVANGTVTITVADDDGSLSDDATDPITITVVGVHQGVAHRVSAVVQPGEGAASRMLMVVGNPTSPPTRDTDKVAVFEGWGYTVTLIDDHANQATIDAALDAADVVYISETVGGGTVGSKFNAATIGIVTEEGYCADDMRLNQTNNGADDRAEVDIDDNTHPITSGLSLGQLTVGSVTLGLRTYTTPAPGAQVLIREVDTGDPLMIAVDTGGALHNAETAAGRRVTLPWGQSNFDVGTLTADGLSIKRKAIQWAAASGSSDKSLGSPVALYAFNQVTVPAPASVGQWALDDTGSSAPSSYGVTLGDRLRPFNGAVIDSYDSSQGPYGGANVASNASVATNSTANNDIVINTGQIRGDVYVGVGGNPASVIQTQNGGSFTGSSAAQANNTSVDLPSPPSLPAHSGNQTYNGGSHTLGSDGTDTTVHYNQMTLNNNAQLTIHGDVVLGLNNQLRVNDGDIVLAADATLTIWSNHHVTLNDGASINDDSARTEDLALYIYGSNRNLTNNGGTISGLVWADGDVTLNNTNSKVYGMVLAGDDITINAGTAIHVDTNLLASGGLFAAGGATAPPAVAADQTGAHPGVYKNGATTVSGGNTGRAASFDGDDDFIEVPHDDAFKLESGAVSLWFNVANTSGNQTLASRDSKSFDEGGHFTIRLVGNDLEVRRQSTTASYFLNYDNVTANVWHHMAYTWGVGGTRLFFNGVLVDTDSYAGGLGETSGGEGNEEPWTFGVGQRRSKDASSEDWDDPYEGLIDDIRLYDGNLTENQATQLASAQTVTDDLDPAIVEDTSGVGVALDLTIDEPDKVSWVSGGGIDIASPGVAIVEAGQAGGKLDALLDASDTFTLVATVRPSTLTGDARVVSLQEADNDRSMGLGRSGSSAQGWARTSGTGGSGTTASASAAVSSGVDQQMVVTYDGAELRLYVDGVKLDTQEVTGTFSPWPSDGQFALASDADGTQAFLGRMTRVAVYDTPATDNDVRALAGLPPLTATGGMTVRWVELD
ncbi:MAG: LamG domain-containing protein [Planctomycetota bacterium]